MMVETTGDKRPESPVPMTEPARPVRRRRPQFFLGLLGTLVLAAAAAYWVLPQFWTASVMGPAIDSYQVRRVEKGPLRISVIEDGNVESASNLDVKCEVQGGSTILWIIPDGTPVTKGTILCKLDKSAIQDQFTQQQIAFQRANSTYIQAREDLAVKEISIKEYLEGTFSQSLDTAESNIFVAKENLRNAENSLAHTERMFRKGYVTELQREQARFAVERGKLDLQASETAKKVLVEFTKPKTLKELNAAYDAAKAKMLAEQKATELEKSKLDHLDGQLQKCEIRAPQAGLVIYANEFGGGFGGGQTLTIEEGARVREFQNIIRLPDLNNMQVKVLVHESKVDRIRPGMHATIKIREFEANGVVTSVSSQPEPNRRMSSSVKEYATYVKIDSGGAQGLKPGMTAEIEIIIDELASVLKIPILGVVEIGGKHYSWVQLPGGKLEKRDVAIGATNDEFIEIRSGLAEKDLVVLNPRTVVKEAQVDRSEIENARRSKNGQKKWDGKPDEPKKGKGEKGERDNGPLANKAGGGPSADGKGSSKGSKKGGPGNGRAGGFSVSSLMANDKNGDGKVSRDEIPPALSGFFDRLDNNKDGAIDAGEAAEAVKRSQQRSPQGRERTDNPPSTPTATREDAAARGSRAAQ